MKRSATQWLRFPLHRARPEATWLTTPQVAWLIIGLGIMLRVVQYGANRSLWLDEAMLALNITRRSFAGLLQPLDYNQVAPMGFLLLERLAVVLFGTSEYALRLVPLLASVAALVLFYPLARACLSPRAVPVALALFATLEPPIYYASEVKQYASDAACCVVLLLIASLIVQEPTARRIAWFGVAGTLLVWLSHPAAFVVGGAGATLLLWYAARKDWRRACWVGLACAASAASFGVSYVVALRVVGNYQYMAANWSDTYVPTAWTINSLQWFASKFFELFRNPVGFGPPVMGVAAFAFLIGALALFRQRRLWLWLLLMPLVVTAVASALQRYPFYGRLLFFATPVLVLVVAEGIEQVRAHTLRGAYISLLLAGLLFAQPVAESALHLFRPIEREELRPAIAYVRTHAQINDIVYVYYSSTYGFSYYTDRHPLATRNVVMGVSARDDLDAYARDIQPLRGNERVWFIFSHVYQDRELDEETFFLDALDRMGTRLDTFEQHGASVYLYDLAEQP